MRSLIQWTILGVWLTVGLHAEEWDDLAHELAQTTEERSWLVEGLWGAERPENNAPREG